MRNPVLGGLVGAALLCSAAFAWAQDGQTLADIREELTVLSGQIDQIRSEIVRSGPAPGLPRDPATALTRLDQLEAELRRLTNRVDVLTNDIRQVVEDASNRVGDIEFRLTELEGGDPSLAGAAAPLGGGLTEPGAAPPPGTGEGAPELAVSERADFDAAVAAVEAGDFAQGAALLERFLATYPGGPLTAEAQFWRGEAMAGQGDWNSAARSYLDSFSGAPEGTLAPRALLRLAVSLGRIGKSTEACLTLAEVEGRYPGSEAAAGVPAERQALNCR